MTSAVFLSYGCGWPRRCDLRWMQEPVGVVAVGNGETCVRRSVQTKSWTDRVCGAKQRHGSCGLSSAEAKATIRLLYPFWCARSAKEINQPIRPYIPHAPLI